MKSSTLSEEQKRALQEKKNLQDFMYQTSTAIATISTVVDVLKNNIESNNAVVGSKIKALEILHENSHERMCQSIDRVTAGMRDSRQELEAFLDMSKRRILNLENLISICESNGPLLDAISKKVDALEQEVQRFSQFTKSESLRLDAKINYQKDSILQEIDSKPSEIPAIESKVNAMIDVIRKEVEGLKEILLISRKDAFITKKTIEAIYTNIGKK